MAGPSLISITVSAADATGIGIGEALVRGAIVNLIPPNEAPKAWMVSAVAAALVAVIVRCTLNWVVMAVSAVVAAIGVLPVWVVGNAGQGRNHDIATSAVIVAILALSVWTGSTVGLWSHHRPVAGRDNSDPDVISIILLPADSVLTTSYGRLAVASTAVVLIAVVFTCVSVLRGRRGEVRPRLNHTAIQLLAVIVI